MRKDIDARTLHTVPLVGVDPKTLVQAYPRRPVLHLPQKRSGKRDERS